ncbi:Metallo-dependent phosphatase [Exidia glandulosa HHB12029]|uniref:Metallo-dependent phosphatase n=1 Tax=Exidia glandulosa HHB12029 TaxID=1314781 RepID=A0A165H9Q1_EXIGL|nr:Metallo-dependent phosphatase [Exidia glandulosa HHB12029]
MLKATLIALWSSIAHVSASAVQRGLQNDGNYNITFIHVNDIHAHLDEFQPIGIDCDSSHECVGGYARLKTKIDELRSKWPDSLLLDCGDEFQGTLFFSFYNGGSKIASTLNQIGFDAITLGNHEFDDGDDKLAEFLQNLTFPVLSANLRTKHVGLGKYVKPYAYFAKHKLAVVGLTTPETIGVSSPGPGTTFRPPATVLAEQVARVKAAHPDVTRFVALTHLGYDEDIELARGSADVAVFLGGHSHTLVGSMKGSHGPYPTVVRNRRGEDVLVATAYRYGEYLGFLNVAFGPRGNVVGWQGEPIHMTKDVKQDAELQTQVKEWRKPFDEYGKTVVGQTTKELSYDCQWKECTLGDLITDVMVAFRRKAGATVHGAVFNSGGIRATIPAGEIRRSHVMTALPFENVIVDMHLTGQELWRTFSGMVDHLSIEGHEINSFLQVSSDFEVVYDPDKPVGSRLLSLRLGGEAVNPRTKYTIVTNDFIAGGGDFFFPMNGSSKHSTGIAALDETIMKYLKTHNPYTPPPMKRIRTPSGTTAPGASHVAFAKADGSSGSTFPIEDGAWAALAVMSACLTFLVLGLEYLRVRDGLR